jgi:outer membrane protein assembly factor BamB
MAALLLFPAAATAADLEWPQFRGPNASGVAAGAAELPVELGPAKNAAWSVEVPPGISSPVLDGRRIYLTALRGKDLITLALDAASGKTLWERHAPAEIIEEVHSTSSPAASTPATDGERVIVFFGSYGILAYGPAGEELWRLPLGPFKNPFGAASSPVIAGDFVLLNCDQDQGSFLLAADKKTGKQRYRVERPEFPRGFSTPVIWEAGNPPRNQVVVAGTLEVKGYALEDGRQLWSAGGLARIVNPTPVLGQGFCFVASFSPGGDAGERISMPPFDQFAAANDADKDGRITDPEVPAGDMKPRFLQLDADKDGYITRAEWDNMARIFDAAQNSLLAFKPETSPAGGVSRAWSYARGVPYVPSPLYLDGTIYMVKDGGIFTTLDGASGELRKQARLPAEGNYYASPVAGAGKIYCGSLGGHLVVIKAAPAWEVLADNDLGERCAATPAIAGGRLYVRTEKRLFAFAAGAGTGSPPEAKAGGE